MADSKFSSLKTRVQTAVVLALILALVIYSGRTAIFCFICAVSLLGQWEFLSLFYPKKEHFFKICYCLLGLLHLLSGWYLPNLNPLFGIGFAALVSSFAALARFSHENAMDNMKRAALGFVSFIYLPVMFSFMSKFSFSQQILVALIPIASDTFAYFAGISFGRHKIWVAVSPKKSVEGCAAGLLASVLVMLYFSYVHGVVQASFPGIVLYGIVLGMLAQMGDFFESGLKRTVNIKDSSNILPGHGGILDRTDSLIFTIAGFELLTLFLRAL